MACCEPRPRMSVAAAWHPLGAILREAVFVNTVLTRLAPPAAPRGTEGQNLAWWRVCALSALVTRLLLGAWRAGRGCGRSSERGRGGAFCEPRLRGSVAAANACTSGYSGRALVSNTGESACQPQVPPIAGRSASRGIPVQDLRRALAARATSSGPRGWGMPELRRISALRRLRSPETRPQRRLLRQRQATLQRASPRHSGSRHRAVQLRSVRPTHDPVLRRQVRRARSRPQRPDPAPAAAGCIT